MGLNKQQIDEILSRHKKARVTAVENFLMTKSGDVMADSMNLEMDASLYKWNSDTIKAIRKGIMTKTKNDQTEVD